MIAVFDTNIVIDALNGVNKADDEYARYERVLIHSPQNRLQRLFPLGCSHRARTAVIVNHPRPRLRKQTRPSSGRKLAYLMGLRYGRSYHCSSNWKLKLKTAVNRA